MNLPRRRGPGGRRGQALAEFALVLPLLLLLVAGLIEFGRGWNIKQAVTDAAREGARYAVVQDPLITSIGDVQDRVKSRLALANLDTTAAMTTVALTPTANFHITGQAVTVDVQTKYRMGFVGSLMGWAGASSTVIIGSQSTMRNE
jgi:Flp pilus assembly protein TadG